MNKQQILQRQGAQYLFYIFIFDLKRLGDSKIIFFQIWKPLKAIASGSYFIADFWLDASFLGFLKT